MKAKICSQPDAKLNWWPQAATSTVWKWLLAQAKTLSTSSFKQIRSSSACTRNNIENYRQWSWNNPYEIIVSNDMYDKKSHDLCRQSRRKPSTGSCVLINESGSKFLCHQLRDSYRPVCLHSLPRHCWRELLLVTKLFSIVLEKAKLTGILEYKIMKLITWVNFQIIRI